MLVPRAQTLVTFMFRSHSTPKRKEQMYTIQTKTDRKEKLLLSIHSWARWYSGTLSQAKFYDSLEYGQLVVQSLKGLGGLTGIVGESSSFSCLRNFQNMSYCTDFKTIFNPSSVHRQEVMEELGL